MRYHFTPTRMAIIKKTTSNKHWKECEKGKPEYTVGGVVNWYNH